MPEVIPISLDDRRELLRFLRFPLQIHERSSPYVAPLESERLRFFNPGLNPFFLHAELQLFLATDARGRVLGRIGAIDNKLHGTYHGERVGFFGFLECRDDPEVSRALLRAAEAWLAERDCTVSRGPASPSTNHECGCLVSGFERPAKLLLAYNAPYLPGLIEDAGYRRVVDLLAFEAPIPEGVPERLDRAARILEERRRFSTRSFDLSRFDEELDRIHVVYNEAWAANEGFVPLTREELGWLGKELKPLVRPDLCRLAEVNGEPAGVMIALPDVNQALRGARGKLFPLGWLKLALGLRRIDALHGLVLGIRPRYRNLGIDYQFYLEGLRAAQRRRFRTVELSWVLEHNHGIVRALERMGANESKRYRIFERDL